MLQPINFEASLPNFYQKIQIWMLDYFLDFGNVSLEYDATLDESNKIKSSTGIAMNWLSPIGPMSFVLSQDLSKADTDVTQSLLFF